MKHDGNVLFSNTKSFYTRIYDRFKLDFPELVVRGATFSPNGPYEISIIIPRRGKVIYNPVGVKETRLKWIDGPYEDEQVIKEREREMRPDMYQTFLREIELYQQFTGASQVEIAKMSGVSRKSINKYLSGIVAPKVSTMRKICESLGIDI